MEKIIKYSTAIEKILTALIILFPCYFLLKWTFMDAPFMKKIGDLGLFAFTLPLEDKIVHLTEVAWIPLSRALACLGDAVGSAPWYLSLWVLRNIFRDYTSTLIFTPLNAQRFGKLGGLVILAPLVAFPLSQAILSAGVTWTNPPGHRFINVSFSNHDLETIFCGVLILVISWVMHEASRLEEEQKFTI